jgi:hypothetical protein
MTWHLLTQAFIECVFESIANTPKLGDVAFNVALFEGIDRLRNRDRGGTANRTLLYHLNACLVLVPCKWWMHFTAASVRRPRSTLDEKRSSWARIIPVTLYLYCDPRCSLGSSSSLSGSELHVPMVPLSRSSAFLPSHIVF